MPGGGDHDRCPARSPHAHWRARTRRGYGVDTLYPPASAERIPPHPQGRRRDPVIGISGSTPRAIASATNGTSGPVSRSFAYARMPGDAIALAAQKLASLRNTLRDNRFVLAAANVSQSVGSGFDSFAAHQLMAGTRDSRFVLGPVFIRRVPRE